jgi:hypothetical protein
MSSTRIFGTTERGLRLPECQLSDEEEVEISAHSTFRKIITLSIHDIKSGCHRDYKASK